MNAIVPSQDGYVGEIAYKHHFIRELGPLSMRFCAQMKGRHVAANARFTYYDLGCGFGDTTVLLAASNPEGHFVGVDFNPEHIEHARRLASESGCANAEFHALSFAQLARLDLPPADYIVMHGIWSWVNDENRRQLLDFIGRRLASGGIVHVSYNALPGQVAVAALSRLLRDHAAHASGPLVERVPGAIDFARSIEAAGSVFFETHPIARNRLNDLSGKDVNYLSHEYFNAEWTPFYHADVRRDFAALGLAHVASGKAIDNVDALTLRSAALKALAGVAPELVETVKDFACNRVFRADMFWRPAGPPATTETMRLALSRPRGACRLDGTSPIGKFTLKAETHAPVLDALADGPLTIREIAARKECAALGLEQVRKSAIGLIALEMIAPSLSREAAEDAKRNAATRRYNDALARRASIEGVAAALASPVLGSGLMLSPVYLAMLGGPNDPKPAAERGFARLPRDSSGVTVAGRKLTSDADLRAECVRRAPEFLHVSRPYLRTMGIEG